MSSGIWLVQRGDETFAFTEREHVEKSVRIPTVAHSSAEQVQYRIDWLHTTKGSIVSDDEEPVGSVTFIPLFDTHIILPLL